MHPPFACPKCRRVLTSEDSHMSCPHCLSRFPIHNGIPELVARECMDSFKETEQHFHDELSDAVKSGSIKGRTSRFHRQFKQPMIDLPNGSAVLELACGTRADGIELAQHGKDVTAIDISLDAVSHSSRLAGLNDAPTMQFAVADAEHLPFQNASFDASFVAASFHHFPHQLEALQEMKRVTKRGGYLIWGVEPASWPYKTVYKLLAPVKRFIRNHRKRNYNSVADDTTEGYTEQGIRELFREAGLDVLNVRRVKFLSECYDSTVRLFARLSRRNVQPWRWLDHALSNMDSALSYVPGLNRLFWHYNVISRVP